MNRSRPRFFRPMGIVAAALALAGCEGEAIQSVLHPAGPAAAEIEWLWWLMFGLGTFVFVVVTILLIFSITLRRREQNDEPPAGSIPFIVIGGLVVPAVILVVLLFYSMSTTMALRMPETSITVEVVGHRWWWEVRYPDLDIITANEIYIPAGEPVELRLWSADVVHSFWVPRLHGKIDLLPEITNRFWIQADEPGTFRGQCAEFCGIQHALMAFFVVALEPDAFETWVSERQGLPPEPETDDQRRGREVFFEAGCDQCHAISGTAAIATTGPDLTHIGSRLSLGAATIENTHGNLAGWVVNPQPIKPGNLMPRTYLSSQDLHALVSYLASLQ